MSDDTATVERLREIHCITCYSIGTQGECDCQQGKIATEAAALIEQQARTIAEQAARLEAAERDIRTLARAIAETHPADCVCVYCEWDRANDAAIGGAKTP